MALPGLCCLCGGGDGASATLGPLLGPVVLNKLRDTAFIHRLCALWSPEVGGPGAAVRVRNSALR